MPLWTDAHNHLQDPRLGDPIPVIDAMRAAGIRRCIVNATCEADWPAVDALATAHPDLVTPAFGIHPWQAHTATPGWQARLTKLLEKHALASIGECGLDACPSSPAIKIQQPVFQEQIRIARELDRPLTIHCVKAWAPLFNAFKTQTPPSSFLMHSFAGSIETARRLLPLGAFFSCSGNILSERQIPRLETFLKLPPDRILLETDAPDMRPPDTRLSHPLPGALNHPANLPAIGIALAAEFHITPDAFAEQTTANTHRCFSI